MGIEKLTKLSRECREEKTVPKMQKIIDAAKASDRIWDKFRDEDKRLQDCADIASARVMNTGVYGDACSCGVTPELLRIIVYIYGNYYDSCLRERIRDIASSMGLLFPHRDVIAPKRDARAGVQNNVRQYDTKKTLKEMVDGLQDGYFPVFVFGNYFKRDPSCLEGTAFDNKQYPGKARGMGEGPFYHRKLVPNYKALENIIGKERMRKMFLLHYDSFLIDRQEEIKKGNGLISQRHTGFYTTVDDIALPNTNIDYVITPEDIVTERKIERYRCFLVGIGTNYADRSRKAVYYCNTDPRGAYTEFCIGIAPLEELYNNPESERTQAYRFILRNLRRNPGFLVEAMHVFLPEAFETRSSLGSFYQQAVGAAGYTVFIDVPELGAPKVAEFTPIKI